LKAEMEMEGGIGEGGPEVELEGEVEMKVDRKLK
jgi:hypothetical protein